MKKYGITLVTLIILGCNISVQTVNKKKDVENLHKESKLTAKAKAYFWENFYSGHYKNIDSVLYYLDAAYNENPNYLETVTHLGFTHIWALSERQKREIISPRIVAHSTLALKYFGESYKLNPRDSRVLGFLADLKMTVAAIGQKLFKWTIWRNKCPNT